MLACVFWTSTASKSLDVLNIYSVLSTEGTASMLDLDLFQLPNEKWYKTQI